MAVWFTITGEVESLLPVRSTGRNSLCLKAKTSEVPATEERKTLPRGGISTRPKRTAKDFLLSTKT